MFPDLRRDVALPVGGAVALFALVVGASLLYAGVVGGSAERLATALLIDAIMVIGMQIYIGNTGILSFGHIGFGAVAGYAFAIGALDPERKARWIADAPGGLADVQVSPVAATSIAVVVTLVVAVIVGVGLSRSGAKSGSVAATVITLALLFVTHEVAVNWVQLTGGNRAPLSFGIGDTLQSRIPVMGMLLAALVAARLFARSRIGRLAKAAREDNLAARAMGVNPQVQQMAALLLSVAIVAVAASLRVYEIGNITPRFFFFEYTLLTLVMLIVGGRNSVTGALLGVVVITAGRELARRLSTEGYELFGLGLDSPPLGWIFREGLPTLGLGLAMLGFMIFRADGLLGDWELDEWLGRRLRRAGEVREPTVPDRAAAGDVLAPATDATLDATGITVDFGGFRALSDAGIRATGSEVVGLIGPNGAGKTTLVNVLTGIVAPSGGNVSIDEVDLHRAPSHEIARHGVVRTFQNLRLFGALTVRENVEVAALAAADRHTDDRHTDDRHTDDRPDPSVDELIAAAGLWAVRERRAGELDYGTSRRLELARAAAARPRFLLLDEPTSGMSDAESSAMIDQVKTMAAIAGAGVVVIDHDLNFITGICDRIYCLDRGIVIAEGTPAEIQADPVVQAAYLGAPSGA